MRRAHLRPARLGTIDPAHGAGVLLDALDARQLSEQDRRHVVVDLTERVEILADDAQVHDENRKLVKHLYAERDALFAFLRQDGVDATNWRAEQAIRPAVVNRRVWGGNRTWRGAATQGRIMSLIRTAAQQNLDVIEFLTRLARAPTPADAPPLFSYSPGSPLVIQRDRLGSDPLSKYADRSTLVLSGT